MIRISRKHSGSDNLSIDRGDASNQSITSCDFIRIALPYSHASISPKVPVYVCNRMPSGGLPRMHELKGRGVKVVVDMDDFWNYPISPGALSQHQEAVQFTIRECIRLADVVTVTTPHLASRVRAINRNVVVIPNALPFDSGQYGKSPDKTSGTFFVWAGSSRGHREDIRILPKEDLTIAGIDPSDKNWQDIMGDAPDVRFKPHLTRQTYMHSYHGHQCALAPLVDTEYSRCKSNLKLLEAGAKGLVLIASGHRPYFNEVDCDKLLYAFNRDDFDRLMKQLKNNPAMLDDYQQSLAEHVRLNYHLHDANELRRQVIESFS